MKVEKQLSLFLENKPGVLAGICEDLAEKKINIQGMTVADHADHAVVRLVVDQPRKAIHLLEQAGMLVIDTDVLAARLPDRPGALAKLARRLAEARVNINYAYGSGTGGGGATTVFLHVSDVRKAAAALRRKRAG